MEAQLVAKVPYLMMQNVHRQAASKGMFNLNMVMLDAAVQKFDIVQAMFPEKQTLVHTVMNRSRIAE